MRLKIISCQVLTREMNQVISASPHTVEVEFLTMGLHDLGSGMRPRLQESIDAADSKGYDAILLGYALCGRGTEGSHAGNTRLVLPRAHDCIALLMADRHRYQAYFDSHSGVYYRSPGWVEFQTPGQILGQAGATAGRILGERRTREEFIEQYGEENGSYLFEQFNAFRSHYSQLTYISPGVEGEDAFRDQARAEAKKEGWRFDEVQGSLSLLRRLVNGEWDDADFLTVPPGSTIRATLGETIVDIA
ncbi:MAG TPA: DUF1638 domain-containing protein [Acidobacteriaceae bacterium]